MSRWELNLGHAPRPPTPFQMPALPGSRCHAGRSAPLAIPNLMARALILAALLLAPGHLCATENEWLIRPDDPPRAKAASERYSVGASVENLPVPPVVPMRQSERKTPPAPDVLMAKAVWGEEATFATFSGERQPVSDWNLVTLDAERFVEQARALETPFHWGNVNLSNFSFDPTKTPSLLFSGVRTLRLDPTILSRLHDYVIRGGMIICDSVYGAPYFYESAKRVFMEAFPGEPFRVLPPDHPLYHVFTTIETVDYPSEPDRTVPFLEGLYVGSRVGVLIAKFGLGTGWDGDQKIMEGLRERGLEPQYYAPESARRIALNLAAYIVGYADAGAAEGRPEVFGLMDRQAPTDEFVFAQLRHTGAWNVHPGAAALLLQQLRRQTAIRVSLKRVIVDPDSDALSAFPFLYLTGLDTFQFSDNAVQSLRTFLAEDGRLLVNNGLGLATFDQAVRRELARLLPDASFRPIPPDHDLFNVLAPVTEVAYASALRTAEPALGNRPALLGMWIGDELRVIYSPYDLEAGWLDTFYPILRGYENESAQRLGLSILAYLMTN